LNGHFTRIINGQGLRTAKACSARNGEAACTGHCTFSLVGHSEQFRRHTHAPIHDRVCVLSISSCCGSVRLLHGILFAGYPCCSPHTQIRIQIRLHCRVVPVRFLNHAILAGSSQARTLLFQFALFVIASGLSFLKTASNPFFAQLGSSGGFGRHSNLSQAFDTHHIFKAMHGESLITQGAAR
jgi:hypothetical protein